MSSFLSWLVSFLIYYIYLFDNAYRKHLSKVVRKSFYQIFKLESLHYFCCASQCFLHKSSFHMHISTMACLSLLFAKIIQIHVIGVKLKIVQI